MGNQRLILFRMELWRRRADDLLLVVTSLKSHYDRLGVARLADVETIHSAFRQRSKALHPDTAELPAAEAAQQFQLLYEAYELLSDPERRRAYDASLVAAALLEATSSNQGPEHFSSQSSGAAKGMGARRPLSGGELFSLMLLSLALLFSLLLGLGMVLLQGRELQVWPSWLTGEQTLGSTSTLRVINVVIASRADAFGPSLPCFFGELASATRR